MTQGNSKWLRKAENVDKGHADEKPARKHIIFDVQLFLV